ncbi:MAG: ATP-binding protein [Candidatus Gastranaerophilales bacterium]|nr:ATP-binding protein [Candidatus Gastranaerophilales bacterium]
MQSSKLRGVKRFVDFVCRELNVDETECYLLVIIFIIQMQEENMDVRSFSQFLGINSIDTINYKPQLEKLMNRKYLYVLGRKRTKFNIFFSNRKNIILHESVMEAILENKPLLEISNEKSDVFQFNKLVSDLIEERENDTISTHELFQLTEELEIDNSHLEFISDFKRMKLDIEERVLLYEMGDDYISYGCSSIGVTLRDMYENVSIRMKKQRELLEKKNILFDLKLVTIEKGGFHNDAVLELTEKCRLMMFQEDLQLLHKKDTIHNLKNCTDIESKELFFKEATEKQIRLITSSLEQSNFEKLQDRLKINKMNSGVAAIFYGAPGTGKSESAYQLAKATGRDIMVVDLSNTKSMWFGESEKKIKEIFTNYRLLCEKSKITPILLFNEADGVLSKRSEYQKSSTSQTENTIQNILLEEFEKNEGIIIATTNLQKNLDAAFERRFLFKVKFEMPDNDIRKMIWLSKIHWIDDEILDKIVARYHFSGGEIDNIFRKIIMSEVTTGIVHDSNLLLEFCDAEKFEAQRDKIRLGFN